MKPLFDLTGRNALARALADAGATVVLNGINPERLKAAEAAMAADYPPGRVHSCAFDVTKDTEAARGVAWVEENVGPLEMRRSINPREPEHPFQNLENWAVCARVCCDEANTGASIYTPDSPPRWQKKGLHYASRPSREVTH